MRRVYLSIGLLAAVAACSTEPVGGRGPFDPIPTRPQQVNPIIVAPPTTTGAPVPGDPTLGPVTQIPTAPFDPNAIESDATLSQDVMNALGTPVPVVPDEQRAGIGIDPNDQSIDLNQFSQEEQKRQREEDARRIAEARSQLVVVQPEAIQQVDDSANVAKYARATTHTIGTKLHRRPAFASKSNSLRTCLKFATAEEAQRRFLATGGPTTDQFNLDPDGDGFACGFDPQPYRSINF